MIPHGSLWLFADEVFLLWDGWVWRFHSFLLGLLGSFFGLGLCLGGLRSSGPRG